MKNQNDFLDKLSVLDKLSIFKSISDIEYKKEFVVVVGKLKLEIKSKKEFDNFYELLKDNMWR